MGTSMEQESREYHLRQQQEERMGRKNTVPTDRDKMRRMADLYTVVVEFPKVVLEYRTSDGCWCRLSHASFVGMPAKYAFRIRVAPPAIPDSWWIKYPEARWCAVSYSGGLLPFKKKPRAYPWGHEGVWAGDRDGQRLPHPRPDWRTELFPRPARLRVRGRK